MESDHFHLILQTIRQTTLDMFCIVLLFLLIVRQIDCGIFNGENNVLKVEDIEKDDWIMVFRATSGNGHSPLKAWLQGSNSIFYKPLSMKRSNGPHYRDGRVSHWSKLNTQYVKYALFNEDKEVSFIIFNGVGSNLTNWFAKKNVITSSWPDLTSNDVFNMFTVTGDDSPQNTRRFFINRSYDECLGDLGHTFVVDGAVNDPRCEFDKQPTYPQFLYSSISSVDYPKSYARADYMAIFIPSGCCEK